MDLEEKRTELKNKVKRYFKLLSDSKIELELLENKKEIKTEDLYNGIESFFSIKKEVTDYEYILGGDGRSAHYSEIRYGNVITATINKDIYLNFEQEEIVYNYIWKKYNPDKLYIA